jgi:hypothetical protein
VEDGHREQADKLARHAADQAPMGPNGHQRRAQHLVDFCVMIPLISRPTRTALHYQMVQIAQPETMIPWHHRRHTSKWWRKHPHPETGSGGTCESWIKEAAHFEIPKAVPESAKSRSPGA